MTVDLVSPVLALFTGAPGFWEIILILTALLLLFGKRLPEVGRSLGKGLVEFKKGLKGVQDEITQIDVEASRSAEAAKKEQDAPRNLPAPDPKPESPSGSTASQPEGQKTA